jgi:hypothetical protein
MFIQMWMFQIKQNKKEIMFIFLPKREAH